MFPVHPIIVVYGMAIIALAGMAIGALTGILVSLLMKCPVQRVLSDALHGLLGIVAGSILCIVLMPRNSITSNEGPNPYIVGVVSAALLSLGWKLYLLKKLRPI